MADKLFGLWDWVLNPELELKLIVVQKCIRILLFTHDAHHMGYVHTHELISTFSSILVVSTIIRMLASLTYSDSRLIAAIGSGFQVRKQVLRDVDFSVWQILFSLLRLCHRVRHPVRDDKKDRQ